MRSDRLRALRELAGLTQEDLANALGISEPQIYRYEKNINDPSGDVLIRMARFFHVSSDYLLGLTDDQDRSAEQQLTPQETAAISAWRRGEFVTAIKIVVADTD